MPSYFASLARKLIRAVHRPDQPRMAKIQKPSLSNFVRTTCVPKWFDYFSDETLGGFHERLDTHFKPLDMGYKRLLTQCRQLYIYVYADKGTQKFLPALAAKYDFILKNYYNPDTGGWAFSAAPDGSPLDTHLDLYAHSFLILSFSQYAQATGNVEAARLSLETAMLIDTKFRHQTQPGFYEALNADLTPIEKLRRQNPHMHLFEACLFAYDVSRKETYARLAHEIYGLFKSFFFNDASGTLTEYFADDLTPDPAEGHRIEAGHHFEWVWLLDYYRRLFPAAKIEAFSYMEKLYAWACENGYDGDYGGIFDEQKADGEILKDTKRIWPLCEAIKAHRAMRPYQEKTALKHLEATKDTFKSKYLKKDTGWVESWDRTFVEIKADYLPGTSVYHL